MKDGEFLFRKSFYESCQEISDIKIRLATYEAICEYGVTGKNNWECYSLTETEQAMIKIILNPIISTIDATKKRHIRNQEIGRQGGLVGGRGNKKNRDDKPMKPQS